MKPVFFFWSQSDATNLGSVNNEASEPCIKQIGDEKKYYGCDCARLDSFEADCEGEEVTFFVHF